MKRLLLLLLGPFFLLNHCDKIHFIGSNSRYPQKIDDTNGVYLLAENFPLIADGKTDDSKAIQAAIDYVEKYHGFGIVFIPSGSYAIKSPVYVWRGIRLVGYGRKRPRFILPENTTGYQTQKQYMVRFVDRKPVLGQNVVELQNTVFFSGISNIDMIIEKNNPNAVAVRFSASQLSVLESMDFELRSGLTAVEQAGSQIIDCSFKGGGYGISIDGSIANSMTLIMNCFFQDHNQSAILTHEAGLNIIGCGFDNMTHAIVVNEGSSEKLFIKDSFCKNITISAVLTSQYHNPENYLIMERFQCANTPNLLLFRDRNTPVVVNAQFYQINELSHGLLIDRQVAGKYDKTIKTKYGYNVLPDLDDPVDFRYPLLPKPKSWFNVREYGAKGDGRTDDTIAFKKAITDHDVIYLPMGLYVITETLLLRKNTKLIGLHPKATQIILMNNTSGFNDPDSLKPMVITPENGRNMISGIGFDPGLNDGVVQLKWMAGKQSYLNDIWFEWGGQGDAQIGSEFPFSLWITGGGGGFFKNIWCANLLAKTSVLIQNTDTPSQVYLMNTENNSSNLLFQNVKNWKMYGLMCEESMGQQTSLMIDVQQSSRIQFNNLFIQREISDKKDNHFSMRINNGSSVIIRGMHNSTWGSASFDNAIFSTENQLFISEKDFSYSRIPER